MKHAHMSTVENVVFNRVWVKGQKMAHLKLKCLYF